MQHFISKLSSLDNKRTITCVETGDSFTGMPSQTLAWFFQVAQKNEYVNILIEDCGRLGDLIYDRVIFNDHNMNRSEFYKHYVYKNLDEELIRMRKNKLLTLGSE